MNWQISLRAFASAAALAVAAASGAAGQTSPQQARVYDDANELASATRGSGRASVEAFLSAKGHDAATTASLAETAQFADRSGRTFARYDQRIGGLRVAGAYVKVAFDEDGALIHLIENLAPAGASVAAATLSPSEALQIALDANFRGQTAPALVRADAAISTFAKPAFFYRAPTAERVVVAAGDLSEGYLVETWSADENLLYHTVVDGLGRIVANELRTNDDSYNVFAIDPDKTAQAVTSGPGAGNAQSPIGWLAGAQVSINIGGNNVRAYLDRDNSNTPDAGGTAVADGNFLTPANLANAPTTAQNQDVAVQNLFYLNNVIHDRLHRHGFVEAQGNFQDDNFGNGGFGNDGVNAEAQDGGGTNNANFATPSDGFRPRMQMYLWTAADPDHDGDLDSDIVWHEYGHGLTWRMIGSMSGAVSGAIGEGMSDTLAIIVNDQDRVAEYSNNNPGGIRSSPYATHLDTIGDFSSVRGVHRNGEIYGATTWALWTIYKREALSADDIFDDLVGGMNFTPAAPTYFHMRDGILAQASAARDCLVWEAFASRGMGFGGSMSSDGSTIVESFAMPEACGGPPVPVPTLLGLAGSASTQKGNKWTATMTASVGNGSGGPGGGVVVAVTAIPGGARSCTTSAAGTCSVSVGGLRRASVASVNFTVTALNGNTSAPGVPQSIVVNRP